MLKIICVKNFHVVKFSWSRSIRELFLTIKDCNMDERLESSWGLVYYQVSGEPGITSCVVVHRTFTPWSVNLCASIFTDHRHVILFVACLIFTVGLNCEIILTAKFSRSTVVSIVSTPCAPPSEKQSGEQSQISWTYYPNAVTTNQIVRSVTTTSSSLPTVKFVHLHLTICTRVIHKIF